MRNRWITATKDITNIMIKGLNEYVVFGEVLTSLVKSDSTDAISEDLSWIFYFLGKIAFSTTNYKLLQDMWETFSGPLPLSPFMAKVLVYQANFDGSKIIIERILDNIKSIEDPLLQALLHIEALFSKALFLLYKQEYGSYESFLMELSAATEKYCARFSDAEELCLNFKLILNTARLIYYYQTLKIEQMREIVSEVTKWLDKATDVQFKGFFYNMLGIYYLQEQNLSQARIYFTKAKEHLERVGDKRTLDAVNTNLGNILIWEGRRDEGRELMLKSYKKTVAVKNYFNAILQALAIADSYYQDNNIEMALIYLEEAKQHYAKAKLVSPQIHSVFTYLLARLGDLITAKLYLEELKTAIKPEDPLSSLFYQLSQGIYLLEAGNLASAEEHLKKALRQADDLQAYNFNLSTITFLSELYLKMFLQTQQLKFIKKLLHLFADLRLIVEELELPLFMISFNLVTAYVYLLMFKFDKARTFIEYAKEVQEKYQYSERAEEISLVEKRHHFLQEYLAKNIDLPNIPFFHTEKEIQLILCNEALRLLRDLQSQTFEATPKKQTQPVLLLIINDSGLAIYSRQFSEELKPDEQLISGFLVALRSFSQDLFGEQSINKIEQANHVILMEKITDRIFSCLIVKDDTYLARKQLKKLKEHFQTKNLGQVLDNLSVVSTDDPIFKQIDSIVKNVFQLEAPQ